MTTRNAPIPVSYRSITRELENPPKFGKPPKDHCDPFLPESRVHTLVQRDRVESTLRAKIPTLTHSDLKKLTNYVMEKASKVFLTLVRSEAVPGHLELFQSHGFTDADLPIGLNGDNGDGICSIRLDGKPKDPNGQSLDLFDNWSDATIENFFQRQWIFLAPTFRKAQFEYNFDHHCSLPFVDLQDMDPQKGGFGAVRRLGLQIEYTDFLSFDKTDQDSKPYVEVAVKVLTSTPAVDVEKFYRKEKETLDVMRSLNDDHLIQAIAVYEKGKQKCFVFPWAEGRSLQHFWERDRTKLSRGLITWAIAQMYGISKAIAKLHGSSEEGIRHGDIKPLNILHFHESRNGSSWGTLVVADVGLAKLHIDYTDLREGTTTKHGTTMYEPPEMLNFAVNTTTISRKYDVWSLGCVFLEFTAWLLYGKAGLDQFYGDLTASKTYRFWIESRRGPILHPVVESLIERIKNDVKQNSALWRLVELVSSWLLIGIDKDRRMAGQPTKFTGRATALELVEELRDIRNIGSKNGSYYFDSDMETIAEQRPDPNLNIATDQGVALRSEQYVSKDRLRKFWCF